MRAFSITHKSPSGALKQYVGIFKHAIDALNDCYQKNGIGKVTVKKVA